LELSPYPRRSHATTVKSSASAGAIVCHMTSVSGQPCNSSSGLPEPTLTRLMTIDSDVSS
jgi:hypothetical protein